MRHRDPRNVRARREWTRSPALHRLVAVGALFGIVCPPLTMAVGGLL